MKLYYSLGACSLSPHIVLREAGLEFELESVDLATHKTASGADFRSVNPKGCVPTLVLEGGDILTEGVAIVQHLADDKPAAKLAPPPGSLDRARVNEWLSFVSSELDRGLEPLFIYPDLPAESRQKFIDRVAMRLDYLNDHLTDRAYLWGESFTIADAYCFTILGWTKQVEMDLERWPAVKRYDQRIAARPKVREALQAEGAA